MCKINQLKLTAGGLPDQLSSKRCVFRILDTRLGGAVLGRRHGAAALTLHYLISSMNNVQKDQTSSPMMAEKYQQVHLHIGERKIKNLL